jgi:hypothetical protein
MENMRESAANLGPSATCEIKHKHTRLQTQVLHRQNGAETQRHTKRYGHRPARQRSQQHQDNMERHRSLKRTLLQAEIQKNSEKQLFTHSDSKQNGKEIPKVQVSASIENRNSTYKN